MIVPKRTVAVDGVVIHRQSGRVLLITRKFDPYKGRDALPGGLVEDNESPLEAVVREVFEETGIRVPNKKFKLVAVRGDPGRDPRGPSLAIGYAALLDGALPKPKGGDDAESAGWCVVSDLPEMAFDHAEIISAALTHFENIGVVIV